MKSYNLYYGRTIYGSVRLYRRYSSPPGRGSFCYKLPSAADPSINQTLCANICKISLPMIVHTLP